MTFTNLTRRMAVTTIFFSNPPLDDETKIILKDYIRYLQSNMSTLVLNYLNIVWFKRC